MLNVLSEKMPSPTVVVAAILAAVAATLVAAWGFEVIGGYRPCPLCLRERIPYYVAVALLAAALIVHLAGMPAVLGRLLLAATAVVFVVSAGLGVHHAGIEWGWWPGPSDCVTNGGAGISMSAAELLAQLETVSVVPCDVAQFRFPPVEWGPSFAGWNALASAGFAVIAAVGVLLGRYGSSSVSQ